MELGREQEWNIPHYYIFENIPVPEYIPFPLPFRSTNHTIQDHWFAGWFHPPPLQHYAAPPPLAYSATSPAVQLLGRKGDPSERTARLLDLVTRSGMGCAGRIFLVDRE